MGLFLLLAIAAAGQGIQASGEWMWEDLARSCEGGWRNVQRLHPEITPASLYRCALVWLERGEHAERLGRLFELAAQMQDRSQQSRTYGNFRWRLADGAVLDTNAVEFAMSAAAVIWLRHRDKLGREEARVLEETLQIAAEGLLRHRVPAGYTNIALLNAANLVLMGQALGRRELSEEGAKRLRRVVEWTWRHGITEYCSPTYYGVDLDALALLDRFASDERVRKWARALIELFWADIASNWFWPAKKLAGAHSRTYDYLHGLGYLDSHLAAVGWLGRDETKARSVYAALARYRVPGWVAELSRRYPRLVRQRWGFLPRCFRVHYVAEGVTLSTAYGPYGYRGHAMDMPLTVDLPGPRDGVRCYLICDVRRDPYGVKKIPEPGGAHMKAVHISPFYAGVQRYEDALVAVVYRPRDLAGQPATVETHFVMPLDVDEIWVGARRIRPGREPFVVEVGPGEAVGVRKGRAGFGLRVLWARAVDGQRARAAVVYDGNEYGAMRLTVAHHSFWGVSRAEKYPGAVLWVRIAPRVGAGEEFRRWLEGFSKADGKAALEGGRLVARAQGVRGELEIVAKEPFWGTERLVPGAEDVVLEVDGEDVGRRILGRLELVRQIASRSEQAPPLVKVRPEGTYFEAEWGKVWGDMVVGEDAQAFGGKYVWMPGPVGQQRSGDGGVTFRLQVQKAGRYRIWGRVLAPTPQDDSFFVRIYTKGGEILPRSAWHTEIHEQWEWAEVTAEMEPLEVELPAGEVYLQVLVREDGTKLDRLFMAAEPEARP